MTLAPIKRIIDHFTLLLHSLFGGWCVSSCSTRLLFSFSSVLTLYLSMWVRVYVEQHNITPITDYQKSLTPLQHRTKSYFILWTSSVHFISLPMNKHIFCNHYNMNPVISKQERAHIFSCGVHPSQRVYSYTNVCVYTVYCGRRTT